jgi:hypothetical protein
MTPSARLQAAIDIVDEAIAAARAGGAAADTLIVRYFKARRYAGSKDRRAVRDLAYAAIRRAGEIPASGRAALVGLAQDQPDLAALFDGSAHAPAPIAPDEAGAAAGFVPGWLAEKLGRTLSPDELPALLDRAPLDLRINRLKSDRDAVLRLLPEAEAGRLSPDALRLPEGTKVEALPAFEQGLIEVQDEGSQLIALATHAVPGMTVVDLCAGAGGKTLALAAMMEGRGRLIACDIDRARLSRLAPRARGAGAWSSPGAGGRRAGGCALLGIGHVAAQSRGALATYPATAGAAYGNAGAGPRARRRSGEARRPVGLCRLLAAGGGGGDAGRGLPGGASRLDSGSGAGRGRARLGRRFAAHASARSHRRLFHRRSM